MRLRLHATLASSVVGLALASPVSFAQQTVPASGAESTNLWFVEMAGKPAADGNALTRVRAEKAEFRKVAKAAGVSFTERRSFDTLFNGFSVAINSANRERLARLPGVAAMYPIFRVDAPSPEEAAGTAPDLVAAITMTGAKEAQDSRGLTGNKIRVGIIDSGIDVDHPAFGGLGTPGTTPFPSTRVAYGYDFVGDGYDAGGVTGSTTPVPDNNPDDCGGHGTHVSGIVGGNGGGIVGVAPGVTFGAYRVFGCNGSTSSDILLAALERAYADKMQVINQSLGAGRQWPQYPTAKASSLLAKKGVIMVASIGNNGPGRQLAGRAVRGRRTGRRKRGDRRRVLRQRAVVLRRRGYAVSATTRRPVRRSRRPAVRWSWRRPERRPLSTTPARPCRRAASAERRRSSVAVSALSS